MGLIHTSSTSPRTPKNGISMRKWRPKHWRSVRTDNDHQYGHSTATGDHTSHRTGCFWVSDVNLSTFIEGASHLFDAEGGGYPKMSCRRLYKEGETLFPITLHHRRLPEGCHHNTSISSIATPPHHTLEKKRRLRTWSFFYRTKLVYVVCFINGLK